MKLPILTEAQILGVKHPIVKGIARLCVTKNSHGFTSSNYSLSPRHIIGSRLYHSLYHESHDNSLR